MGRFFANIHIKRTRRVPLSKVITYMDRHMSELGYMRVYDENKADVKVGVYYPPKRQWTSIYSEAFNCNIDDFIKYTAECANALPTDILSIMCIDSDCLLLNLVNKEDNIDAFAVNGHADEYEIKWSTTLDGWRGRVKDIDSFGECVENKYIFSEEVLEPIAPMLTLPLEQSNTEYDSMGRLEFPEYAYRLFYALQKPNGEPMLPKFKCIMRSPVLYYPGERGDVSVVNLGDKSRGLIIEFYGNYVENEEITFSDVELIYSDEKWEEHREKINLEKKLLENGEYVYRWEDRDFFIHERVDNRLPPKKEQEDSFRKAIMLSFMPHGDKRKFLDISFRIIPMGNIDGAYSFCLWKRYSSKREFIERHNKTINELIEALKEKGIPTFSDHANDLINPDDYDLE